MLFVILLSLLPEFDTMTEDQIRKFKIKVMMLIDELKSSNSQFRPIRYSTTSSIGSPFESSLSRTHTSSVTSPQANQFSPITYTTETE